MSIYEINSQPTIEKVNNFDENSNVYYRFQMKDWEIGTQSWGMIYGSAEEAIECCEDDGLTPETAVLNGKSCCSTAKELAELSSSFDKDFRILVVEGNWIEYGHDDEDVVEITEIKEIWDFNEFLNLVDSMEE
ncbi:hypothetical protein [Clostridium sporogenes]|uniref:hypothetical protein n=1 Tax=Clostridium sporogenes TaxID=1509 RepID=UPI0007177EC8|nr:hypothetical protein [Clostridium sporogenes]KRU40030.1 hypothetical protein VT94_25070 [Clostridium sporogenes]MBY7065155.1 hypothetical protein [Clostridium sporogenes]MBY7071799.1 hypothetical protein [Clostridium sporogenes]MCW6065857.1 hypothetical protein [Clostridium sporogenes]OQP88572.1 hypothetical protein VT93_0202160 [Clostridium sporogenes]